MRTVSPAPSFRLHFPGSLGLFITACANDPGGSGRAFFATFRAIGPESPGLGKQRQLLRGQHLLFTDQSIAPAKRAYATRSLVTGAYGTFPRILRKYLRKEHALTLKDAIRKFTALPAQQMRLADRDVLKQGMWADVVIFDPEVILDLATYEQPNQLSKGMEFALVNGVPGIAEGKMTGALQGKVRRGPGYVAGERGIRSRAPCLVTRLATTYARSWVIPLVTASIERLSAIRVGSRSCGGALFGRLKRSFEL